MNGKSQIQKKQASVNGIKVSEEKQEIFFGPLPHPESLRQYNEIVPGSAERILKMAENESENRHRNETYVTKHAVKTTHIGILFAFLSVLILSGLVGFALYKGYQNAAGYIVGSTAAVAGAFIFVKRNNKGSK